MQTDDESDVLDARSLVAKSLPLLPSASKFETIKTLKAAISARASLSAYSQALKQSPLSATAISAFSTIESTAALQLEGQAVELKNALQGRYDHACDGLARHIDTRRSAHGQLLQRPVGSTLALDLASSLEGTSVAVRRVSEKSQCLPITDPNFNKLSPPEGAERLQALLDNWNGFVQQDAGDLDPLIMSAAAHGQWLALRPFTGSNIAVGQLLTSLLMCEEELLPAPALPLSLYFSTRAEKYWANLYQAVAHGRYEQWLQFFMTAVNEAAIDATQQLMAWEDLHAGLHSVMRELLPKEPTLQLVAVCNSPSFSLADLSEAGLTRRQTASSWMQRLVAENLLSEIRVGKQKRYVNNRVLSLLLG